MRELNAVRPSHFRFKLVAMATISKSAACNKYAGEMGVELVESPRDLLQFGFLDLILELTGDPAIMTDLITHKPPTVGLLDRQAAMLFLDITTLFDQITVRETEINLATSFASTLLEASPDGVLVIDRNYRIINCNDSPLINSDKSKDSLKGDALAIAGLLTILWLMATTLPSIGLKVSAIFFLRKMVAWGLFCSTVAPSLGSRISSCLPKRRRAKSSMPTRTRPPYSTRAQVCP